MPIPDGMMVRPKMHSKWDPASPHTLARLLATISPRASPLSSSALASGLDTETSDITSPTVGGSDGSSDLSGSSALGLQDLAMEHEAPRNDAGEARLDVMGLEELEEDEADLLSAVKGVWNLWQKTRRRAGTRLRGESDKDVFLRTVHRVLDRQ